jgi:hypothetical protein
MLLPINSITFVRTFSARSKRTANLTVPAKAALLALALLTLAGCITPKDKSRQLERVAKDWCLTIRASQVLPAYPLTQDLMPGDVFLTSTVIGDEVRQFEERGFLPLDQHLVRLALPGVQNAVGGLYTGRFDGATFPAPSNWTQMPQAAFPSYSFSISRAGGLNLAVPVQGVPVGLNLLGSADANATISIKKAKTVGSDIAGLHPLVEAWAKDNAELLKPYGSFPGDPQARPVYLRVLTRVYYTGEVDIHMSDTSAQGGQASAGIDVPLQTPDNPQGKSQTELYNDLVAKLNTTATTQFGAKVKITGASRRTVSLQESFDPPLVIGYLAYDRLVRADGSLGPPVSTLVRVNRWTYADPQNFNFNTANYVSAWYTKDLAARKPLIDAWAQQNAPGVNIVTLLSSDEYDALRLRMIRDLGIR